MLEKLGSRKREGERKTFCAKVKKSRFVVATSLKAKVGDVSLGTSERCKGG